MTKTLCIYHGNCADGFGAAWAVRKALGADNVEFHAGVYQNPPPDVRGRDVLIVDFSYKRAVLAEMAKTARSILILDHHKTAIEDLSEVVTAPTWPAWQAATANVPLSVSVRCAKRFDLDRSGAGLTWDYLHAGTPRPALIDHIEDRDLWRFALPKTREIQACVFSYPYDFEIWDALMAADPGTLAIEGAAIERKHHKDIAELVGVTRREMVIGGIRVPIANLPYTLTSDAGHKMATEHESRIGVCYWDTAEGRVFSLRSTDDGPDVSAIAKSYGGGGHAHASGFRMPIGWEGDQ
jgi:uncharacterized protein